MSEPGNGFVDVFVIEKRYRKSRLLQLDQVKEDEIGKHPKGELFSPVLVTAGSVGFVLRLQIKLK